MNHQLKTAREIWLERTVIWPTVVLTLLGVVLTSCINFVGGAATSDPRQMQSGLGPGARRLIELAYKDIDPARLTDYHTHIVGLGTGQTGAFANREMQSLLHPVKFVKFSVYKSACGITDMSRADQQYMDRLRLLARNAPSPSVYHILAFDKHHNEDGSVNDALTEFHVPNRYMYDLVEKDPDLFRPVISVHPYRKDALVELETWAKRGVRFVKWLPNAMGIDPSSPRCDPFYRMMKQYNMTLISHTGEEQAVDAELHQRLGNPLLLRRPLNMGVRVVAAHCAGLGTNVDLDDPQKKKISNFKLFMRLMDDKRYQGLFFGEISSLNFANRTGEPLLTLLARPDLHSRLRNGSDYPLPAINVVIQTKSLVRQGYITEEERVHLNEIYKYNPLLFDFVVKRTIKLPGTNKSFSPAVFMSDPETGL